MKAVLLVDDDAAFRFLLATVLRTAGLEVVEVTRVAVAEEALRRRAFDLVVVDGLLPDGNGLDFIERLRAHDRQTRLIFVSAFFKDLRTFERLTRELGVSRVVSKPVDPEDLSKQILALLDQPAAPPSSAAPPSLAAKLGVLRAEYRASLPQKLAKLELAVTHAQGDRSGVAEARLLAHRLRGTAGSYGLPAVSKAMGRAEDLLVGFLEAPASATGTAWEGIAEAVRDARASLVDGPSGEVQVIALGTATPKALLVVDDDPDFLKLAQQVGRKLLIKVVTAETEPEAIEIARRTPLFGAILDVHLRGQSSFALARAIRGTEANADVPIAFASADLDIETRVAAVEAGGTRYFEKPLSEQGLSVLAQQLASAADEKAGRVLIVDDDPDVVAHYTACLRAAGIKVEATATAVGLTDKLEELHPDVLLLDVNLPGISGLDVCRALRMSNRFELLPILIVTAQTDDRTRLLAFRAGASDVISKPAIPEELLARVGGQLERMRLVHDLADRDAVSGLLLRRAVVEALQMSLASAARHHTRLSLILLDLDRFKSINDDFGHLAGDQVLVRLGDLLRRRFRLEDIRGRWGGDELIAIFPGESAEFAELAARRVLADFAAESFTSEDGKPFSATLTAGVAAYPEDGATISALLQAADRRLYSGKQQGRNQVGAAGEGQKALT